jgi:hypothetical protein
MEVIMTTVAFWSWVLSNEAALATILLIISELLGAIPQIKSNGIVSFIILQLKEQLKKRGGQDPTP